MNLSPSRPPQRCYHASGITPHCLSIDPLAQARCPQARQEHAGRFRFRQSALCGLASEAATRGHQNASLLIVGRPSLRQRLDRRRALDLDALAVAGIAPPDHFVNEAAVRGEIGKLARAAQQQLVTERPFPGIIRLILDGTVVRVRLDRKATNLSVLVVLGIRRDGQKVLRVLKN